MRPDSDCLELSQVVRYTAQMKVIHYSRPAILANRIRLVLVSNALNIQDVQPGVGARDFKVCRADNNVEHDEARVL